MTQDDAKNKEKLQTDLCMHPGMTISEKANRVLIFVLLALLLILLRVWYLSVLQHETQASLAQRPKKRVVIEPVERATIVDRFGIPLAINKICYHAAITYAPIREIPSVKYEKVGFGKTEKHLPRLKYISQLASFLSEELEIDPAALEDLIHGRASLFPHAPFVIKENISEEQYYRLRMLQADWPGIEPLKTSYRFYPRGKSGCDVIGYLGAISTAKYHAIREEMQELEAYISARERGESPFLPKGFISPLAVRDRLHELQEKAYSINDLVGKAGVEGFYDAELRGVHGKKICEVDIKGNILREMAGSRPPISGQKIVLSLSSELQEYAENLLAAHEGSLSSTDSLNEGWIRGGAVVAMIPQTGEVVALASYPRFDPNDFIFSGSVEEKKKKKAAVSRWLEDLSYVGQIWDGKEVLKREYFSFAQNKYIEETLYLSWPVFLNSILPPSLNETLNAISDLQTAYRVQEHGIYHPLLRDIPKEEDRLLIVDLCHLLVPTSLFTEETLSLFGKQPLSEYNALRQGAMRLLSRLKPDVQKLYHLTDFKSWRQTRFKELLRSKRAEEKAQRRYARPYTDYLEIAEKTLFEAFWNAYKWIFFYGALTGKPAFSLEDYPHLDPYIRHLSSLQIENDPALYSLRSLVSSLPPKTALDYLQTMRGFDELAEELQGKYAHLRHEKGHQLGKHLAAAFYPTSRFGHCRSQAFRQLSAPGSVFKLVTSYAALAAQKESQQPLNPLTLIDDLQGSRLSKSPKQVVGYTVEGTPIPRLYKGGMLPRSSRSGIGKIELIKALERSSNIYFSLLAGEYLPSPEKLAEAAKLFGFGQKTGIDLPGELSGSLPDDLIQNKTGLYSFAIGHHTFEATALQTALMMTTLANQGVAVRPKVVQTLIGAEKVREEEAIFSTPTYPFKEALSTIGIDFPLFTEPMGHLHRTARTEQGTDIIRRVPFSKPIQDLIFEGMRLSIGGERGTARPAVMKNDIHHPTALRDYFYLHQDLIGKTGTAQVRYKQTLGRSSSSELRWHIFYAAISYPKELRHASNRYDHPELVVVVFLRFAKAGREGGPIAAQVVKKWREILDRKPPSS